MSQSYFIVDIVEIVGQGFVDIQKILATHVAKIMFDKKDNVDKC